MISIHITIEVINSYTMTGRITNAFAYVSIYVMVTVLDA